MGERPEPREVSRRRFVPALVAVGLLALSGCAADATQDTDVRSSPVAVPGTAAGSPLTAPGPIGSAAEGLSVGDPLTGDEIELVEIAAIPVALALTWRASEPDMLYVAEQSGEVHRVDRTSGAREVVLDLSPLTTPAGEQGLLGLAFDPAGEQLYVSYTDAEGSSRIDGYLVDDDGTADLGSRREVLLLEQPSVDHNGGNLVFGPDGYLYVGLGDGGGTADPDRRALDRGNLFGSLLRIDPSAPSDDLGYTVPFDNPFVDDPDSRSEIWSYGLRNPWRFSFDRETGDLWIGDVGQSEREEINFSPVAAGAGRAANFGWSAYEGSERLHEDQTADGHQGPLVEFERDGRNCSITGGYVYRGSEIAALAGAYVYGDFCSGDIWALRALDDGTLDRVTLATMPFLTSFGEDAYGELYALTQVGTLFRLGPRS